MYKDSLEFRWPLSGIAAAAMSISRGFNIDDVEMLEQNFAIAKKVLLKAANALETRAP